MKRLRFAAVGLLLASLVFGVQNRTFEWTPPTEREDGTPLADSEIAEYRIYCNGEQLAIVQNLGDTREFLSPPLAPGAYECYATAVDLAGLESGASNLVNFTVTPSRPAAPRNFTVAFAGG